jgi:hypothetical protein
LNSVLGLLCLHLVQVLIFMMIVVLLGCVDRLSTKRADFFENVYHLQYTCPSE